MLTGSAELELTANLINKGYGSTDLRVAPSPREQILYYCEEPTLTMKAIVVVSKFIINNDYLQEFNEQEQLIFRRHNIIGSRLYLSEQERIEQIRLIIQVINDPEKPFVIKETSHLPDHPDSKKVALARIKSKEHEKVLEVSFKAFESLQYDQSWLKSCCDTVDFISMFCKAICSRECCHLWICCGCIGAVVILGLVSGEEAGQP